MSDIDCPFESVKSAIAFSSRDFSLSNHDAWVYGIIVGWEECLDEICDKHGWNEETKERLRQLRISWEKMENEFAKKQREQK